MGTRPTNESTEDDFGLMEIADLLRLYGAVLKVREKDAYSLRSVQTFRDRHNLSADSGHASDCTPESGEAAGESHAGGIVGDRNPSRRS